MLEQSGILTEPGLGSIFLALALFCYLVISRIIKTIKKDGDANKLVDEVVPSPQAVTPNNTADIVAAITAAVNEYRRQWN